VALLVVLLAGIVSASPSPKDKNKAAVGRLLTGKVLDKHDGLIADAVVYLTNAQTHEVKTYIVSEDGAYHFPELSPNVDYEVFAQFKGVRSDTRTVSQFDDRTQVNIVLRIDRK
jgi:hypothetical protein